ncbi:MAG: hypothetical protein ACKOQ4_05725 [Mycobacterium sp.]
MPLPNNPRRVVVVALAAGSPLVVVDPAAADEVFAPNSRRLNAAAVHANGAAAGAAVFGERTTDPPALAAARANRDRPTELIGAAVGFTGNADAAGTLTDTGVLATGACGTVIDRRFARVRPADAASDVPAD